MVLLLGPSIFDKNMIHVVAAGALDSLALYWLQEDRATGPLRLTGRLRLAGLAPDRHHRCCPLWCLVTVTDVLLLSPVSSQYIGAWQDHVQATGAPTVAPRTPWDTASHRPL